MSWVSSALFTVFVVGDLVGDICLVEIGAFEFSELAALVAGLF
jgi:hypothetical protein